MSFSVSKNYLLLLLSPSAALGELADHSSPLFYELEIRLRRRISCQKIQPRPLSVASKKLTRVELSYKPTNTGFFLLMQQSSKVFLSLLAAGGGQKNGSNFGTTTEHILKTTHVTKITAGFGLIHAYTGFENCPFTCRATANLPSRSCK